eukprot:TRINITY_DN226_c1_g1_i2.p1 TRINITY_DN226_c1_g1~~TRINITY_DN226_c1_g1_i2.p1  ORF type:complete len:598 (-),score=148.71 TRINITY_DN226_c1_g1_i2:156-1949(-)
MDNHNALIVLGTVVTGAAILYFLLLRKKEDEDESSAGRDGKGKSASSSSSTASASTAETNEVDVGAEDDFAPGTMKEVKVGNRFKVLLVRTKRGKLHCTGSKCTHYNAPLVKGVLEGDRVTCPWHGACFNVCTGDIEDAPALDAINVYSVRVADGRVLVTVPTTAPDFRRTQTMCQHSPATPRTFVIIGAGAAGQVAAETLRQEGFSGRIVLLSNERHRPYDRVKLSKSLAVDVSKIELRPESFFHEHNIEIHHSDEGTVTAVDVQTKSVTVASGTNYTYDKLLVATGGIARSIRCDGHDLNNIHTLRVPDDTAHIAKAVVPGRNVVIIGSSFIGMEVAALLVAKNRGMKSVTVVGMEKTPFERVLGPDIGARFQELHESRGVQFRVQRVLQKYIGDDDGNVTGVELDNGDVLEADLVVVGAGIIPSTAFLEGVLPRERDGSVIVDECLRVPGVDDVFVAGDIARFPYWHTGETIRIEHWDVAQQHGRVAAKNMVARTRSGVHPYASVPFFWTAAYGTSLRYAGNAMRWDRLIVHGSIQDLQFVSYFVQGDRVVACATVGTDPVAVKVAELLRTKTMPSASELDGHTDPNFILGVSA